MTSINIAIVDDHQLFRDGIHSLLAANDQYRVVISASNGTEFFESLASGVKPDIVLLDLTMPEMDGFEVMQKLKTAYPHIKTIALSMHDDGNYITKSVRSGAYGYLLKNTDEDELLSAIQSVYRGRKYFNQEITGKMINNLSAESETKKLSIKEKEILKMISEGLITKEIADQLFISTRTVETHRVNIMKKLNAKNTAEMIKKAVLTGLLE
ncbi:MAG: DNA-binding response regulator [Cyclobacteriaceae bacterium]|nr:MAG: DNA-binding response regulator [Cyclobacteriaceae bacterium]